jgi:hypothetical protein
MQGTGVVAETTDDLDRAQAALNAIRAATPHRLAITPFSFRKTAQNPAQRELIVPFGGTGCVALYGGRQPVKSRGAGGTPPVRRGPSLTPEIVDPTR